MLLLSSLDASVFLEIFDVKKSVSFKTETCYVRCGYKAGVSVSCNIILFSSQCQIADSVFQSLHFHFHVYFNHCK